MFEIEQKYVIGSLDGLLERLAAEGAVHVGESQNQDTYYNHPCRDFAQTGEALRIRREDSVPKVTYKGIKKPGSVKAREELEWRLDPGDLDGSFMERLLLHLGFREVATVNKRRQTYRIGSDTDAMTITVDEVPALGSDGRPGLYAEIECVLPSASPTETEIEAARANITALAEKLHLTHPEFRSYLRMQLERGDQTPNEKPLNDRTGGAAIQ